MKYLHLDLWFIATPFILLKRETKPELRISCLQTGYRYYNVMLQHLATVVLKVFVGFVNACLQHLWEVAAVLFNAAEPASRCCIFALEVVAPFVFVNVVPCLINTKLLQDELWLLTGWKERCNQGFINPKTLWTLGCNSVRLRLCSREWKGTNNLYDYTRAGWSTRDLLYR